MPSVSSQPFSVSFFFSPGRGDEKNKVSLFYKWCLKMLAVFFSLSLSLNGKNSVNAKLIIIASGDLSDTYCFNLRRIGIRLC